MDPTNAIALASSGIENLLAEFVRLPNTPGESRPAEEFQGRNGMLSPDVPAPDYWGYVKQFQQAWTAKTKNELDAASMSIQRIFEREPGLPRSGNTDDTSVRPTFVVDFATGKIEPRPRTLLDALALALLVNRRKLCVCERKIEGCPQPFIIKSHGRQRFCSSCAQLVRGEKKEKWWAENRQRFLEKWKHERKPLKSVRKKKFSSRKEKK